MVTIRPCRPDDGPPLHAAARESIAEIFPWMPWCHPEITVDELNAWVTQQIVAFEAGTSYEFVIVDDAGRICGACGLNQIDPVYRRANLGYWLRSSATGRGYATSAVRQLVEWAFANTNLNRLEIVVALGNDASSRVAEKAGALREGVARSRLFLHERAHDAAVFAFVRV
ncbi:MAG: GNAT family N-acetyltransferase [Thermoanaerobaculia bacterium]